MKAAKIVLVAGVLAVVGVGCLGSTKSLCEYADGKACVDVDGGLDGAMPDGVAPDGTIPDTGTDAEPPPKDCLTPMEPAKNPEKCLVDAFGAFVSPSGDDANDGTKAKPYKTLGRALQGVRTRLVVCEGEYAGSIDVTRAVEIYSGVTCDFTKAGGKAKLVASKAAYAIKVEKVAGPVVLADLDVVGMNGAAPSESSVGVFVTESGNVKLLRSRVEAGDGADAPMARDGSFTFPADTMLKGANADDKMTGIPGDDTGGAGGSTGTCPGGGNSKGGDGGNASLQGGDATPRPPGGAKGPVGDCTAAGAGLPGDPGPPGQSRSGAVVPAALTSSGMAGSKGQDGSPGTIGGGGGGGFGFSGAGGGGGAGGCGGQGGFGGGAGGSSIAVLSFASTVSLESTELIAKVAKPGGTGGKGQTGQLGGARGTGSGMACNGGNGAKGGDGGAGGGGAGGIAAGIAWAGKEPTKDAATKITRPTGPAPVGGEGGAGASNKGVDGAHADVFEVK